MSQFVGADVEQLDSLARRFEASAQKLAEVAARSSIVIMAAEWVGADIDRLRAQWDRQAKPGLAASSQALSSLSTALKTQAQQQRTTSSAGTAAIAGAAGGGPTGTGTSGGGGGGGGGSAIPGGGGDGVGTGGGASTGTNHIGGGAEVGPDGVVIGGSMYGMAGTSGGSSGELRNGPLYTGYKTSGIAGAEGGGKFSSSVGKDGLRLNGNLDGRAGAGGSVETRSGIDGVGSIGAHAEGFAGAEFHEANHLNVNKDGFDYGQSVHTYAGATGSLDTDVKVGDVDLANNLEGFAGARLNADAGAYAGPDGVGANFGFDALAGAEIKQTESISGGGFSASASASAYAGAGIDLRKNGFDLSYDKVGVDLDLGAALGVGFGGSIDVSVSPKYYVDKIGGLFGF